jgi:hypothetical protein
MSRSCSNLQSLAMAKERCSPQHGHRGLHAGP